MAEVSESDWSGGLKDLALLLLLLVLRFIWLPSGDIIDASGLFDLIGLWSLVKDVARTSLFTLGSLEVLPAPLAKSSLRAASSAADSDSTLAPSAREDGT